jgi:YD repeat-containing protein
VTCPDGQTLALGYDAGGRLSTLTQPRGTTTLAYTPATGQFTTITAPDGGTLNYTYDGALVTSETWGGPAGAVSGSVSRTYDSDFRIASERVNGTNPITFAYDPDSLLTQAGAVTLTRDPQTGFLTGTALGSATDTRTYSTFGELTSYRAATGLTDLLAVQYTRDSLGRITQKTETIGGVTDTFGYTYDLAGRLTEVQKNGAVLASYAYAANANRLSRTTPGATVSGTYDAQDRLLQYGDATYSYTANGELASKTTPAGTTTYRYDVVGNLLGVTLPDGTAIDYVVDGCNLGSDRML